VKKKVRIVGFDCAEDEHAAVLLDMSGEFERRVDVINERGQIQESLAELMLRSGSSRDGSMSSMREDRFRSLWPS